MKMPLGTDWWFSYVWLEQKSIKSKKIAFLGPFSIPPSKFSKMVPKWKNQNEKDLV